MGKHAASPERRLTVIGGATIAGLLLFTVLALSGTVRSWISPAGSREVTAVFRDAKQLHAGSEVRRDDGARSAAVVMKLDDGAGPLYADARADLRWRLLLGGNFAVNFERGTRKAGDLGDRPIPATRTASQVELEDITSALGERERRGLRLLTDEAARALRRPAVVDEALGAVADETPALERTLRAVRGQRPETDIERLVATASRTVHALDAPGDQMAALIANAAATLSTTGARGGDIAATLRLAPAAMSQTRTTLARLHGTLDGLDPMIADLNGPAARVKPAVDVLRPTLVHASSLLRRASPLLADLRPAVRSLAGAAPSGVQLVDRAAPSLDRLDKEILPYMSEIDPDTDHSASQMVGPALGGLGGAAAQMDDNGHFFRFPASAGSNSFYLPCATYAGNPDKDRYIECQGLQSALQTLMTYNPVGPPPGSDPGATKRRRSR